MDLFSLIVFGLTGHGMKTFWQHVLTVNHHFLRHSCGPSPGACNTGVRSRVGGCETLQIKYTHAVNLVVDAEVWGGDKTTPIFQPSDAHISISRRG